VKQLFITFLMSLVSLMLIGQDQTVGLLSYRKHLTADGYTLIFPRQQSTVYLINNCGEVVHQWDDDSIYVPNNAVYLYDNGNLLKCKKSSQGTIGMGGGGYFVELLTWENDLIWSYELNTVDERLHHDVEVLPNGNILMIAWERKSKEEAMANGRLEETLTNGVLFPDYIFEINPITDEKVWEWHTWDHLIQDVDSTKLNFDIVKDHPELIDLNYVENTGSLDWDWLHMNAIDYHPELDQIMLCVPYFNELWVIDHSTTTDEAASHEGGTYGRGGDLLYRIGNPQSYKRGGEADQILFFPHDTHWARDLIDTSHPNYDDILVFNNQLPGNTSQMEIVDNMWSRDSLQYLTENGIYLPKEFTNSIVHPVPEQFYSEGLSSVQVLPNGNILGCSGGRGYLMELTSDNEIVWEYKVPLKFGARAPQGTEIGYYQNLTFRAFKYPPDYSAFDGRDLSAKGYIELNPDLSYCDKLTVTSDIETYDISMYPNPASTELTISWEGTKVKNIKILDMISKELFSISTRSNSATINISTLSRGTYVVVFNNERRKLLVVSK